MMTYPSLERRLTLRLGALFLCAFVAAAALQFASSWSYRQLQLAEDMGELAAEIGQSVRLEKSGAAYFAPSTSLKRRLSALHDMELSIRDLSSGQLLWGKAVNHPFWLLSAAGSTRFEGNFTFQAADGVIRYGTIRHVKKTEGRSFVVEMLRSAAAWDDFLAWLEDEFIEEMLVLLLALGVIVIVVAWLSVRGGLKPLRQLSADARAIHILSTDVRLRENNVPTEILPLVRAVNEAIDRLAEAFKSMQKFTAHAAHELRTPLAVMRARADSIAGDVSAALRTDLDRMAKIVDQLLSMARLKAEQVKCDEIINLVEVVRTALAGIVPLAFAQGKEIALWAQAERIMVRGNADALNNAVRNVVENALRYTPESGAADVLVRSGAVVEVRDRGPGIPDALRERIFSPFFRADPQHPGSGLGLAIVAETIALHGGKVSFENVATGGAIVRMNLPQLAA